MPEVKAEGVLKIWMIRLDSFYNSNFKEGLVYGLPSSKSRIR